MTGLKGNDVRKSKCLISKKKVWVAIISMTLTVVVFAICYRHSYMIYMTNDDAGIQNLLNGFTTGTNEPAHQFISIFIGYPLAHLYGMVPGVQWWYVYSQFLMLIGTFLINYAFITVGSDVFCRDNKEIEIKSVFWKNTISLLMISVTVIMFNILFALPALASTSFTIVPGLYGGGIVALLFLGGYWHKAKPGFLITILLLYLPVLFHRKRVGYVILCYLLLVCLYVLLRNNTFKDTLKKWVFYAVVAVLILFTFVKVDMLYKDQLNGNDFVEFNKARAEFMDHPKDSFDDNPKLYEEVGWDRDTYVMASNWCFVDERCTAESFSYVAKNSHAEQTTLAGILKSVFQDKGMKCLLISFFLFWSAVLLVIISLRDKQNLIFLVIDILGTVTLIGYQVLTRRVVYRSLVICLLPAFVFMGLLLISSCRQDIRADSKDTSDISESGSFKIDFKGKVKVGFLLVIVTLTFYCVCAVVGNFINLREIRTSVYSDCDDLINQYIMNHKDCFYVMQIGIKENLNPRLIYQDDISNSFFWGGSDYHSHARKQLLEKNGLKKLDDKAFLMDNVYLISNESYNTEIGEEEKTELETISCLYAFCHYMQNLHPDYVLEKTDEIYEGMNVYHFVRN